MSTRCLKHLKRKGCNGEIGVGEDHGQMHGEHLRTAFAHDNIVNIRNTLEYAKKIVL
jgi:hypothetical protein